MIIYESKLEGTRTQYDQLDQAIRTGRFVRNSIIRAWMDNQIKSRNDAYKYCKILWLEYFGSIYGVPVIAVNPKYTSQNCSNCGTTVTKTLSTRTHKCPNCGYEADRDENAALNILKEALKQLSTTVGRTECKVKARGSPLLRSGNWSE